VLQGAVPVAAPAEPARLLEGSGTRYRLYTGFAGWAPQQLQSEMQRNGWYVLPADLETIFRKNMEGVWQELVQRARSARRVATAAGGPQMKSPAVGGAVSPETPGSAARAAHQLRGSVATLGTRRNAASFTAAHADGIRTVARNPAFPRLGNPATVASPRRKITTARGRIQEENRSYNVNAWSSQGRCAQVAAARRPNEHA
jgi:hypothetical protein